jgi:futalosine hydrolase
MPANRAIGLLSATSSEAEGVLAAMKGRRVLKDGATGGRISGQKVMHTVMGIGPASAARTAALLIERHRPTALVIFGIGGAYPVSGLSIGDVALATTEVYADLGTDSPEGFLTLKEMGLPLAQVGRKKLYNEIPLDKGLLKITRQVLKGAKMGRFATVSLATGNIGWARELERRFRVICENMEGAAAAHAALLAGVPALELRAISNIVEDRDLSKWDKELAVRNVAEAVVKVFRGM